MKLLPNLWSLSAGTVDRMAGYLGSGQIDLAVTGLSRAGKTVFITSLVRNLLAASARLPLPASDHMSGFLPLADGTIRTVHSPSGATQRLPRFPYRDNLAALTAAEPVWPRRTSQVSEYELDLLFDDPRRAAGRPRKHLRLRMIDYPGEWLLDLALLDQDFMAWSAGALDLSQQGMRRGLSEEWYRLVHGSDWLGPSDENTARAAALAYQRYLVACRDRGLTLLQPARFLRDEGNGDEVTPPALDRPQYWFCPLPPAPAGGWPKGSTGAAMAERYHSYCHETVATFFRLAFGQVGRQIVLVDVIGALAAGQEVFEDMRASLQMVTRALTQHRRSGWRRWVRLDGRLPLDRVLLVATKADHVPKSQRENLVGILRGVLGEEFNTMAAAWTVPVLRYVGAMVATESTVRLVDGVRKEALSGIEVDRSTRTTILIEDLPSRLPDRDYWASRPEGAAFVRFKPPLFEPDDLKGMPQIGLDGLLQDLLADQLK